MFCKSLTFSPKTGLKVCCVTQVLVGVSTFFLAAGLRVNSYLRSKKGINSLADSVVFGLGTLMNVSARSGYFLHVPPRIPALFEGLYTVAL